MRNTYEPHLQTITTKQQIEVCQNTLYLFEVRLLGFSSVDRDPYH